MITPAATPPEAPGQMPQADTPGPAPVPYAGGTQRPEPPLYGPDPVSFASPGPDVMAGVSGAMGVQESGYAHDVNAGLTAPYYAGGTQAIYVGGDADAGGRDDMAASVAASVAAAEARFAEHLTDVGAGGRIGDTMTLPASPLDPGVGSTGTTDPAGAYYDPPRNYGG